MEAESESEAMQRASSLLQARLSHARVSGRRLRYRVTGSCVLLGLLFTHTGMAWMGGFMLGLLQTHYLHLGNLTQQMGAVFFLYALLPTDRRLIRLTCVGFLFILACGLGLAIVWTLILSFQGRGVDLWVVILVLVIFLLIAAVAFLVQGLRKHQPRHILRRMMVCVQCAIVGLGFLFLAHCIGAVQITSPSIGEAEDDNEVHKEVNEALWIWDLGSALALFVLSAALLPACKARVGGWLAGRDGDSASATMIAGLISGPNGRETADSAAEKFRYVSCELVTQEALFYNEPDPELFKLTKWAAMGSVDSFISHSWHDSSKHKWSELQAWRQEFLEEHGVEPRLWFDKYCIDQRNIDQSLPCLPVFLSGCQGFLILAGKTYLSRLWCVIELFVFLQMGGSAERLTMRMVCGTTADVQEVRQLMVSFDARSASCAVVDDRERLLGIVDMAFGGLDQFSASVRQMLVDQNASWIDAARTTYRPSSSARTALATDDFSSEERLFEDNQDKDAEENSTEAAVPGALSDPAIDIIRVEPTLRSSRVVKEYSF